MVEITMNGLQEMRKLIEEGDIDVLRTMVKQMAEALMGAEVDVLCGAAHGERHPERTNQRNGYRERAWDTRTGTIELALPKLRSGFYFPDWRRRTARGGRSRHPRLHGSAQGGLAPGLEQQPPGALEPRDPPAHGRGRHLSQPRRGPAPRRRRARRAE